MGRKLLHSRFLHERGHNMVRPLSSSIARRNPPAMSLALPFQTAKQLAAAVRKKKIGCLELLDLYLKRVEAHNPELNAIIATDIEGARKRAKAADKAVKRAVKLGPLHGVPMTIKESYDVAGLPTTWGNPAYKATFAMDVMAGPDEIEGRGWKLALPRSKKKKLRDFKVAVLLSDPNAEVDHSVQSEIQKLADFLGKQRVKVSDKARPAIDTAELND